MALVRGRCRTGGASAGRRALSRSRCRLWRLVGMSSLSSGTAWYCGFGGRGASGMGPCRVPERRTGRPDGRANHEKITVGHKMPGAASVPNGDLQGWVCGNEGNYVLAYNPRLRAAKAVRTYMDDERPGKWGRLKNWLHKHSEIPNWALVAIGGLGLVTAGIQTYQGWVTIGDREEQQRPRLSLRIELEQIDDPAGFRIIAPLEIGGTTGARRVVLKNYVTPDKAGQRDYISAIDVDWNSREGHLLGDVSTTEVGRRFVGARLSQHQIKTIFSTEESLYFIARLLYGRVSLLYCEARILRYQR